MVDALGGQLPSSMTGATPSSPASSPSSVASSIAPPPELDAAPELLPELDAAPELPPPVTRWVGSLESPSFAALWHEASAAAAMKGTRSEPASRAERCIALGLTPRIHPEAGHDRPKFLSPM